jgi:hypothetical protein
MLGVVLLAFAFVFACFAAANYRSDPSAVPPAWWLTRIHLGWVAIAFYFASLLFSSIIRIIG